ncbi:SRPBCC domain-containing protein [Hahella sp. KA22]|uniref:SRPBCC family protein n=1 Tax=Hahella sp. KA22 TaxID=1628392 RepID=UPI000FDF5AC6|nr:SRPBCC domain-containing protein [Hahella sp. KA22]AZZ92659.1 SRPBCC domain-containing protein [Hahella sp. KA22]QAY56032.1 SRPBCC domain-containing protein [Hahella sp. KA22]
MNANLQFDFIVDKDNNTITVKREFQAKRQLVWDCYTKSELLDQWFAPKPFTTKTKTMDFREGGCWHYAMIDPEGTEYWGRLDYQTIRPIENYTALDGFSDATGEVNPSMPRSKWDVTFEEKAEHALVHTVIAYNTLKDLETVIQMGMKEGLTSTLERLDELLLTFK